MAAWLSPGCVMVPRACWPCVAPDFFQITHRVQSAIMDFRSIEAGICAQTSWQALLLFLKIRKLTSSGLRFITFHHLDFKSILVRACAHRLPARQRQPGGLQ